MLKISLTIPLNPKPKASVKLGKRGAYNPSSKGMSAVARMVKSILGDLPLPLTKGPVFVLVHHHFPLASNISKKRREALDSTYCDKRPDGDNLEKFLNDSMNGILWEDDKRIVATYWVKTWTKHSKGFTDLMLIEVPPTYDRENIVQEINSFFGLA